MYNSMLIFVEFHDVYMQVVRSKGCDASPTRTSQALLRLQQELSEAQHKWRDTNDELFQSEVEVVALKGQLSHNRVPQLQLVSFLCSAC